MFFNDGKQIDLVFLVGRVKVENKVLTLFYLWIGNEKVERAAAYNRTMIQKNIIVYSFRIHFYLILSQSKECTTGKAQRWKGSRGRRSVDLMELELSVCINIYVEYKS